MFFTKGLEDKENEQRESEAKTIAKAFPFSNLHNTAEDGHESERSNVGSVSERKSALKRVSQSIQDYHFKHNTLYGLSYILLGVVSAATLSWINLPYQLLFIMHSFLKGFSFNKCHTVVQRFMSWLLLAMLLSELVMQYVLYINTFSKIYTARDKYAREVHGLLWNTTSFIVFGMKVILLIVECKRLQFQKHLSQLTFIVQAQNLITSVCNKSFSFFAKLLAPISQFFYCMIALIFILLHPSVVFALVFPIMILAFFSDLKSRKSCNMFTLARGLTLIFAMVFTVALYIYHLTQLHQNDTLLSKWRQEKAIKQDWEYLFEVIGLTEVGKNQKSLLMRTLFPLHYEMLFIMVLATFSKYSDIRAAFLRKQEDKKLHRQGTSIPDSQKDYADALHQDGFSSSATEDHVSDDNLEKNSATAEQVQEKDETLRGRFYSFFQVCYTGIKWALQKGLNFATIHSTKIAQAMLFSITALDPNIFNGCLFVLFLGISMGNNS